MKTYIVTLHYEKVEGGTQVFTLLVQVGEEAPYPIDYAIDKCILRLNLGQPVKSLAQKAFNNDDIEIVAIQ